MQEEAVARSIVDSVLERLRRIRSGRQLREYRVAFSETSLSVVCDSVIELRGRTTKWDLPWPEVQSITAFKTDDIAVDTIWVLVSDDEGKSVSFPEESLGFQAAIEAFPNYLNGCRAPSEWMAQVALPPFAENATQIYPVAAA